MLNKFYQNTIDICNKYQYSLPLYKGSYTGLKFWKKFKAINFEIKLIWELNWCHCIIVYNFLHYGSVVQ